MFILLKFIFLQYYIFLSVTFNIGKMKIFEQQRYKYIRNLIKLNHKFYIHKKYRF